MDNTVHPKWSADNDVGDVVVSAMKIINAKNYGTLVFPTGPGLVNQTIEITSSYVGLKCSGGDRSCIVMMSVADRPQVLVSKYSAATQMFAAPDGIYNLNISGLYFNRAVANGGHASLGDDGIVLSGFVDRSTLNNVVVIGSYNNIIFGPASTSSATSILTMNAVNDNIAFRPQPGHSGSIMQWELLRVDAAGAGRYGIFVSDEGATENGGLGQWLNIQPYSNNSGSLRIAAANNSISGFRADSSWFCCSVNADQEIYLDLHGGINNHMTGTSVEQSPGYGIFLTSGVGDLGFSDGKVFSSKKSGIYSAAAKLNLSGSTLRWNGSGASGSDRDGLTLTAGDATVTGLSAYQNGGYGVRTTVDALYFAGGDLSDNGIGPLGASLGLVNSSICSVKGVTGLCK